jgi:hypothetical protein
MAYPLNTLHQFHEPVSMESETKIASPLEKPAQEATKNEIDL